MKIGLLLLAFLVWADETAVTTKKAEELVKKRDRAAAIKLLTQTIEKHKGRTKENTALVEQLKTVSQMFFTDEGQRAYESASSLYFYSPKESRVQAEKALVAEPGNSRILLMLVQLDLKEHNCEAAQNRLASIPIYVLTETEKGYHHGLIAYCDKRNFMETHLKKNESPFREFFMGVQQSLENKPMTAKTYLNQAVEKEPQFPEPYYWLWKLDEENEEYGSKYVQLCKNLDVKTQRKFKNFPFICSHLAEMPSFEVKDDL